MSIKMIVVGKVGRDAEMRYTQSGTPVSSFSVASDRKWKDKNGERQVKTTWVRVTAWAGLAEMIAQYVKKGDIVWVEGEQVEASAFLNKENEPSASLELTLSQFNFVKSAGRSTEAPAGNEEEEEDVPF